MSRIGMTLRIGAGYDRLEVVSGGRETIIDRSGMLGIQKKQVLRDVQKTRHFNNSVAG